MKSPVTVTEEDKYWLYALEVVEGHKPTGDEHETREAYFDDHDVTRPQNLTEDDLPPADADPVRKLDRQALDEVKTGGKWHVQTSAETIDRFWSDVVDDVADQTIWGAKAMTRTGYDAHPGEDYMLLVYTPNYFEKHDVDRIRRCLRDTYDVTEDLIYKPNVYSANGIQPDTAEE